MKYACGVIYSFTKTACAGHGTVVVTAHLTIGVSLMSCVIPGMLQHLHSVAKYKKGLAFVSADVLLQFVLCQHVFAMHVVVLCVGKITLKVPLPR
jgi:hypothetical protein